MNTTTANDTDERDKHSKLKGGVTEEDRSKGAGSAEASGDIRARGGVTEEDRSKGLSTDDDL